MAWKSKEKEKEYRDRYYQEHREELKAKARQYYQEHKEETAGKKRKYFLDHKEEIYKTHKKRLHRIKLEVFAHYSKGIPRCAVCGIVDIDILSIDHIEGGGNEHRRKLGGLTGGEFCSWLKKNNYPASFQVLCRNCNWKKRMEAFN